MPDPNWLHGIDVSHYQDPSALPWGEIAKTSRFCIVKATDGTGSDPRCIEHVKRAHDAGLVVGLYAFFRDPVDVGAQFDAFATVSGNTEIGPGDLIPVLDIEDYPGHTIGPATSAPAEQWCELAAKQWGGAMPYITQRDWARIGAPTWMLAYPLFVAHYPGRELPGPATPDHRPWRLWQYAVHPYAPGVWTNDFKTPLAIDHSWALDPLPVIAQPGQVAPEPTLITTGTPTYLTDVDWAELQAARSRDVESEDS